MAFLNYAMLVFMSESPPNQFENKIDEKEERRKEIIALAVELSENQEGFPFPGIDPEAYLKLKSEEEELPGYATPIDELIERFKNEGMKIVLGKYPGSGNFFILPLLSNDIENDSIFPEHLQIIGTIDERLKKLISMNRS